MLTLELLEDRVTPSVVGDIAEAFTSLMVLAAPQSSWHFTSGEQFNHGGYADPGDPGALGFNLVEVFSPQDLSRVPNGDKALVFLGQTDGVTTNFVNAVHPYIGDPRVLGFYICDEPNPAVVPASNLQAESDWVHTHDQGALTFFVSPGDYAAYTPANTHMDLVGLDPYPAREGGYNPWYIPYAVLSTEMAGWSNQQIVPVYQAFGDQGIFAAPTAEEMATDLAIWGELTPHPVFEFAYTWAPWGAQDALSNRADWQAIFQTHNNEPSLASVFTTFVAHAEADLAAGKIF